MLNDQVTSVTQIANLFYFAVDPETISSGKPIRFCNQKTYFNNYMSLTDIHHNLCGSTTNKQQLCDSLDKLINDITNQTNAVHQKYSIMLGQRGSNQPKFIAVILQSTTPIAKAHTILNYQLFTLFKGKLAGNPQYVRVMRSPFPLIPVRPLRYGGIAWTTPPSQGGTTLISGEKLANVNLQAFNNLANQWRPEQQVTDYAKACQTDPTNLQ